MTTPRDRRPGSPREPFAARLHFMPMALRRPQNALVRVLRRYFERAPGWVLLTTSLLRRGVASRPIVRVRPEAIAHPPATPVGPH